VSEQELVSSLERKSEDVMDSEGDKNQFFVGFIKLVSCGYMPALSCLGLHVCLRMDVTRDNPSLSAFTYQIICGLCERV